MLPSRRLPIETSCWSKAASCSKPTARRSVPTRPRCIAISACKTAESKRRTRMPFIDVASHRLEYERIDVGSHDRPTLVLLHEGLGSIAMWRDFPQRLAHATVSRVVVYSRYGYGNSDSLREPRDVRYMHDEALVALPSLLEKLHITRPILVGHSDGASIALIHAGAASRPVMGVVAMAPHVIVEDISIKSIAAAREAYEATALRTRLARYHADVDGAFRGWNDIWLHPYFRG